MVDGWEERNGKNGRRIDGFDHFERSKREDAERRDRNRRSIKVHLFVRMYIYLTFIVLHEISSQALLQRGRILFFFF
jgi:hypothetical protein